MARWKHEIARFIVPSKQRLGKFEQLASHVIAALADFLLMFLRFEFEQIKRSRNLQAQVHILVIL